MSNCNLLIDHSILKQNDLLLTICRTIFNRKMCVRAPTIPYDAANTHYCYVVWIYSGLANWQDVLTVMASLSYKQHSGRECREQCREKDVERKIP